MKKFAHKKLIVDQNVHENTARAKRCPSKEPPPLSKKVAPNRCSKYLYKNLPELLLPKTALSSLFWRKEKQQNTPSPRCKISPLQLLGCTWCILCSLNNIFNVVKYIWALGGGGGITFFLIERFSCKMKYLKWKKVFLENFVRPVCFSSLF